MSSRYQMGPAVLVTAAFIGPGTVMTASRAGAQYGFVVLWAVAFSVLTAIVLQSMAARLGIISGGGVAEALKTAFKNRVLNVLVMILVLGAILFGNSAYQTGNILGAANGLSLLSPLDSKVWSVVIAVVAIAIIWLGRFSVFQWVLTGLVAVMGVVFVVSALQSNPDWGEVFAGFKPSIPNGSEWALVGLIGTTVVPYNLFLHASAAARRYEGMNQKTDAIRHSNLDTIIAIGIGGVVTMALTITAAVTFGGGVESVSVQQIAEQLRPTLGDWAEYAFAIGLFAAGLTSSLTAPVAAAFATSGCFGWDTELSNPRMKAIATIVVGIGLVFALVFGGSPTETIIVAQIANGLLLPILAAFLLFTLNRSDLLGDNKNGWITNGLGAIVLLVTLVLASRQFVKVWDTISRMFEAT